MQKIESVSDLKSAIEALEKRREMEREEVKGQVASVYENLKPANMIKNAYSDFIKNTDVKGDLVNATMGIASGFLSKKMVIGETESPIKKILGSFLQMGVTNVVIKNADVIKEKAIDVFQSLFAKKENPVE